MCVVAEREERWTTSSQARSLQSSAALSQYYLHRAGNTRYCWGYRSHTFLFFDFQNKFILLTSHLLLLSLGGFGAWPWDLPWLDRALDKIPGETWWTISWEFTFYRWYSDSNGYYYAWAGRGLSLVNHEFRKNYNLHNWAWRFVQQENSFTKSSFNSKFLVYVFKHKFLFRLVEYTDG